MKTREFRQVIIPTWALPAIVNNDFSGLNEEERTMVRDWMFENIQSNFVELDSVSQICEISVNTKDGNTQEFFSNFPEFGLPSTCVMCTIGIFTTTF